jgi:hypothetical protein
VKKICPYCKEPLDFTGSTEIIHHKCLDGFAYYIVKKDHLKK